MAVRVVFWGTPDFGRRILKALLDSAHDVVGVVTQPDRPAGRGRKPRPPPVKLEAAERGVTLLQPEKPVGERFMAELGALAPDISVVAAYGQILRQEVLDLPRLGSINVHASLLPKLRGAAPVNWAIINGDDHSGVTIMRMVQRLDAGPIILQERCDVPPRATAGELAVRLAELGAGALIEALSLIEAGRAREELQVEADATFAPKLQVEDVRVDWSRSGAEIDRWIRGSDPSPGAWSELEGLRVRLFAPEPDDRAADAEPGTVVSADPRAGLEIATGSGRISIAEVQPAGRRRMGASDWVRGRGASVGQRFA